MGRLFRVDRDRQLSLRVRRGLLPDIGFAEVFTSSGNQVTMGGQFAPPSGRTSRSLAATG